MLIVEYGDPQGLEYYSRIPDALRPFYSVCVCHLPKELERNTGEVDVTTLLRRHCRACDHAVMPSHATHAI